MGNNLNLIQMFGVPKEIKCSFCNQRTLTYFDDYDIECGDPNPSPGTWNLTYQCEHCEHDGLFTFVTSPDLARERDDYKEKYQFMVDRVCNEKLDGYRELAAKCAELEARLYDLTHVDVISLIKLLSDVKNRDDMFSAVFNANKILKDKISLVKENYDKQMCAFRDSLEDLCLKLSDDNTHEYKHNGYNITHEHEFKSCIYCGKQISVKLD
jgi:hypothetical protein